jgi:molybdopterin-guanine dinucleotide biosynthesis protein A
VKFLFEREVKQMKQFGSAVILAGGKSSRMGFDKQQVRIGGVSMVCYIAKQLEALFDEIIIVTNTPEYYEALESSHKRIIIGDIYKDNGPLGGLHAGLSRSSSEWTYVTACDMPVINADYIRMMEGIIKDEGLDHLDFFSCVTKINGLIEPFNAFYSSSKSTIVETGILEGRLKFSRFVTENNHRIIEEDLAKKYSKDLTMFMNLNTLMNLETNTALNDRIDFPA